MSLPLAASHPTLTSFFSIIYLGLFFPAFLVSYAVMPGKWKRYWLLLCSLGYYWLVSGELIVFLLASALVCWGLGKWLAHLHQKRDEAVHAAEKAERKAIRRAYTAKTRGVLALGFAAELGMLLVIKYSAFAVTSLNDAFGLGLTVPELTAPIGLSFFSLQALSYLFDVYRQTIPADGNFLRVALWLSFFPQIVEGPICRYQQTAQALWDVGKMRYVNLTMGLQRIGWGLLKKLVVADRLNAFVEAVFTDYVNLPGGVIALGALCYTAQLYADFSGSMDAIAGIGEILGVTMPENFRQPFFSRTVSEFWTRWHITLGTWFKDYLFFPLSMSGPLKKLTTRARKRLGNHYGPLLAGALALLAVWVCNGAWHGAGWNYLFFGLYHFAIILTGDLIAPPVKKLRMRLGINADSAPYRAFQILRTGVLVVIGELFFRAEGLQAGLTMFGKMVTNFRFTGLNAEMLDDMSIDGKDFLIVAVTLILTTVIGVLRERGISVRKKIASLPTPARWAVYYAFIFFIILFGAYGEGYIPVDPMYADF